MGTISIALDDTNGFTPVIDVVAAELGLVPAVVYGVVWRHCQMDKGVCFASLATMAKKLGLNPATVQRHIQKLCDTGYLEDTTPDLRNKPHAYRDTGRVVITALVEARIAERKADGETIAHSNVTLHTATSHCGEYVEETIRDKEDTIPVAVAPVASAPVKKRTLSPQQQVHNSKRGEIQEHIEKLTGLTPPSNAKMAGALWWAPITEMCEIMAWDSAGVKALLSTVVAKMRQDNLTISSAKSLVNNFRSEAARESLVQAQKRATVVSSGGKPWWADGNSMKMPVQTQHGRGNDG